MPNAVYGIFKKGQIILNEPVNAPDESSVIVVFLGNGATVPMQNNKLLEMFDTLGPWEDSKDTETIISEIEKSRVSRTEDVIL